jgi:hypothetical protein
MLLMLPTVSIGVMPGFPVVGLPWLDGRCKSRTVLCSSSTHGMLGVDPMVNSADYRSAYTLRTGIYRVYR